MPTPNGKINHINENSNKKRRPDRLVSNDAGEGVAAGKMPRPIINTLNATTEHYRCFGCI